MKHDRIEGHWKQTKGRARKAAGRWLPSASQPAARAARQREERYLGTDEEAGGDRQPRTRFEELA